MPFLRIATFILSTAISMALHAQVKNRAEAWADSVYNALTPDQRLGQLFMVAAYSNQSEKQYKNIDSLIVKYGVGGLIFFQGGPYRQALLTNRYQSLAKVPLLIGMDAEWGLQMRLDSTFSFSRQMTLGATANPDLAYQMGKHIAQHCKTLGVHVSFSPVIDINNNPANPVIGVRSFGENKELVAKMGAAYMKGLQDNGVMACAKHFPGHGDTDTDSHLDLPTIKHSKKRLQEVELYPFKTLIDEGLMSCMVAHLQIPSLEARPNVASTLSQNVVTQLLKKELNFKGLVFTDALNMKGVSKYYAPGEVDVMALRAGNDVLLFAENVPVAIQKIKAAINDGNLKWENLETSVKKILKAKYQTGAAFFNAIDTTLLTQKLNTTENAALKQSIFEQAVTVVSNDDEILPYKKVDNINYACLSIGLTKNGLLHQTLNRYAPFKHFLAPKKLTEALAAQLADSLKDYQNIVISFHDLSGKRKDNYGLSAEVFELILKLQKKAQITVVVFGHAYTLKTFEWAESLVCAYEDNEAAHRVVPQILFGALPSTGKLPVTVSQELKYGKGIRISTLSRLKYKFAEQVGYSAAHFQKLDSVLKNAVDLGYTPGLQAIVVKNGQVIYENNYGYQSYDAMYKVTPETLYDLASVTKTAATTQAIMWLYDKKQLNTEKYITEYLPEAKSTNKEHIKIKDLLVHQAGLQPYMEFWRKGITKEPIGLNAQFLSKKFTKDFPLQISAGMYAKTENTDSVYKWVLASPLLKEVLGDGCPAYKYSDLGFFLLKQIAERVSNEKLEVILDKNIYKPLGTWSLCYNPTKKFPTKQIAPTEEDKFFRGERVHGFVHDQNAAFVGGVAGHAGLFGRANDLAIIGQMLLQNGEYAGRQYFSKETIQEFTRQIYTNNRRAMGWDRPFPPDEVSLASPRAYGHTGFTGTAWWIDPEDQMVFVLLTNRTYPFADNKKYTEKSVRTQALNAAYEAVRAIKLP